jgi:glycine hydroxymethyltransferase
MQKTAGYPFNYFIEKTEEDGWASFLLKGQKINEFNNFVFTSDIEAIQHGKTQKTSFFTPSGFISATLKKLDHYTFQLSMPKSVAAYGSAWLRDLSDAYTVFDDDLLRRIPGPVIISDTDLEPISEAQEATNEMKPWFIGCKPSGAKSLPIFNWNEPENPRLKKTVLHQTHQDMGARMVPFAGWEMPVQYSSIQEEHAATRKAAGLFDVSHMGVLQANGPYACVFLDNVCGNDISSLDNGKSCYTHLLTPDGEVIDDLIVYRRSEENFLVVVNASNKEKDWAWLTAVRDGKVKVDNHNPAARVYGRNVILKDLADPIHGKEMLIDLALQGKAATKILLALGTEDSTKKELRQLNRSSMMTGTFGGFDLIISRTGYTGENIGYEIFIHPDHAATFWNQLLQVGEPHGLKPCGLGARDSLRTEYGLPLYGHEMAGPLNATVGEAGFSYFVKTYKPWFIGRDAFLAQETTRERELVRFRFEEQRTKKAYLGDPVLNEKGKVIGTVTSCAIDSDGYFTGQAIVDKAYTEEGTVLLVFQDASDKVNLSPAALDINDRITLPGRIIVLSRYMKL